MSETMKRFFLILVSVSILLAAFTAGHTTYVLTQHELTTASQGQQTFSDLLASLRVTEVITIGIGFLVLVLLAISLLHIKLHQKRVRSFFDSLESHHGWVPAILRFIMGITLLVGGLKSDYLFAPDMPIFSTAMGNLEAVIGVLLLFGLVTEIAALVTLALALYSAIVHGSVMLNHLEVVGTSLLLLAWGGGKFSVNHKDSPWLLWLQHLRQRINHLRPYGVALLRWSVGLSFIIMAMNEKLLHPSLSLAVVEKFGLAAQLGVRPEFYVLSAGLIEIGLGVLLLAGFLTRFVGVIAFVVFTLSMLRFGEETLPHLLMMAIFIGYFVTGAQKPSIDRLLMRKKRTPNDG